MPYSKEAEMELFQFSNYIWNPYALAPAVVGVGIALLGLAVLLREQWSPVSIVFFGMTAEGAVWLLGSAGVCFSRQPSVALQWARIENAGVVFIPSLVYLFALAVVGKLRRYRAAVLAALLISALFGFSIEYTPWFVRGVQRFFWGYFAQYGRLSIPFLFFFSSLLIASLLTYWSEYRRLPQGTQRKRLGIFLVAFSIAYLGSVDFVATFGIPFYPFGYIPALIFLAIVAWTIWRYRLVDITPAFAAAQILKTVSDALLVFDQEGVVRVANQAACDLFERLEQDLLGQPIWKVDGGFFPRERFETFIRTPVIHSYEAVHSSRQGRKIVLDVAVSGIRDQLGQPAAVVCVARDLTERKLAEEELRRVHEALKKSHRELKEAQMHLVEAAKMESVGRLAAGIAHEVKNPLAVILQGLDYLDGHLPAVDDNLSMVVRDGKDAVRRADRVLRGLLDFSALKSLDLSECSLNSIIEQALLLVRYSVEASRVQLVQELDPKLPMLSLDKNKMEQVFVNLLMNAVQAMPNGGELTVRTLTEERTIIIEVEDTGTGIPPEALPKVFEPFFTTKPAGKGTGLGLTVAKSLIELQGGRIEMRNRPEGGAKATLLFERAKVKK